MGEVMGKVAGRIIASETGTGIPDLIVMIYDLDPKVSPDKLLHGPKQSPRADFWRQIPGQRLGSVLTDEQGDFKLDYVASSLRQSHGDAGLNLGLFVVAPEDADLDPYPRLLHASCGMRPRAGPVESFLIKLSIKTLRSAGITVPGASLSLRDRPGQEDLLAKMRQFASDRDGEKPFSEHYVVRREQPIDVLNQPVQPGIPPRSFGFDLPVQFTNEKDRSGELEITQDDETGALLLTSKDQTRPTVPLTFRGVQYTEETAGDQPSGRSACFVVDPDTGEFHVRVRRSSERLTAVELFRGARDVDTGPSEPYWWFERQSR